MRIGSRTRDQMGMLCATGAVACLAIFNVQWSRELPVQPNHWEQDLFGDLAAPGVRVSQEDAAKRATRPPRSVFESGHEKLMSVEQIIETTELPRSEPLEPQPRASRAQFIRPVRHQHQHQPPEAAPTVWLSGGIELLSDDPAPGSEPGVQYFPDVPQDTTSRPESE